MTNTFAGWQTANSPHYVFHFRQGSHAHAHIQHIIDAQESAYAQITAALGVQPGFPLRYFLLDTPEDVGEAYGDNEACNGFALSPDTVYAVYNDAVQCIGPHEDAHLLAELIGRPGSAFVREGLAMHFDARWWGRPNEAWASEFAQQSRLPALDSLLTDEYFHSLEDALTYPVAGAMTSFLIARFGMAQYLSFYRLAGHQVHRQFEDHFGSMAAVERDFIAFLTSRT